MTSFAGSVSDARSSGRGGMPKRPIWRIPGPRSNRSMTRNRSTKRFGGVDVHDPKCASSRRTGVSRLLTTASPASRARKSAAENRCCRKRLLTNDADCAAGYVAATSKASSNPRPDRFGHGAKHLDLGSPTIRAPTPVATRCPASPLYGRKADINGSLFHNWRGNCPTMSGPAGTASQFRHFRACHGDPVPMARRIARRSAASG